MEATLDKFGRIVIPKRVREELGLDPGTVLDIEGGKGRIVLSPRRTEPDLVREDGVLVFTGEAVGDLEAAGEAHRRRRSRDVAGWGSR
jgi:AbrB family looped-hinge helix DNA binding protein